jgi:hypothetical protein
VNTAFESTMLKEGIKANDLIQADSDPTYPYVIRCTLHELDAVQAFLVRSRASGESTEGADSERIIARMVDDISQQCNMAARDAMLGLIEKVERQAQDLGRPGGTVTTIDVTDAFRQIAAEVRALAVQP